MIPFKPLPQITLRKLKPADVGLKSNLIFDNLRTDYPFDDDYKSSKEVVKMGKMRAKEDIETLKRSIANWRLSTENAEIASRLRYPHLYNRDGVFCGIVKNGVVKAWENDARAISFARE